MIANSPLHHWTARLSSAVLAVVLLSWAAVPAGADVQVANRKDVVVLKNGTRIECIVVMTSSRGAMVIIQNPKKEDDSRQEFIPMTDIKKIIRGQAVEGKDKEGRPTTIKGFKTEVVETQKVIQGEGYRRTTTRRKKKGTVGPVLPKGKIGAAEPLIEQGLKTVPLGLQPLANTKLTPKEIVGAYIQRYPDLENAAEYFLGGTNRAENLIKKANAGDIGTAKHLKSLMMPLLGDVEDAPNAPKP